MFTKKVEEEDEKKDGKEQSFNELLESISYDDEEKTDKDNE